jgi:hypothetical protein
MSDTKFTPGPWLYQPRGSLILDGSSGSSQVLISTVAVNTRRNEGRYNAHLIAAAPSLYAKVVELEMYLLEEDRDYGGSQDHFETEALLAKARGEAQ